MQEASPTDVRPEAQQALADSPIHELRDLRVEQQNGTLLIHGLVSSFYHKQLAQEVVRAVCREIEIELVNAVRVR
jgi:osmotically-inducible protein OsmY